MMMVIKNEKEKRKFRHERQISPDMDTFPYVWIAFRCCYIKQAARVEEYAGKRKHLKRRVDEVEVEVVG